MRTSIFMYLGLAAAVAVLGCVLGFARAPSAAIAGVILGGALIVPVFNLAGHYSRIRYPVVHLLALVLLVVEGVIVAAIAVGLSRR